MRHAMLACALLLQGCASFNANYKANKFADEARRLDREGRTIEAGGYWGRASVKADSLLAHSPDGKYSAVAWAIKGEAYAAVGQCGQASKILPTAIEQLKKVDGREQATLALASCELRTGVPALAATTVEPVTQSRDASRRRVAQLLLGTAERQAGRDSAALVALAPLPGTPALVQRTLAYVGVGNAPAATSAFDSLVALRDSTLPWDSLLTITGRTDPELASQFTTTLDRSKVLSLERAAALSFADATRLGAVDTAQQRQRYEYIIQLAGPADPGVLARFAIVRMGIPVADSIAQLAAIVVAMDTLAASNGLVAASVAPIRNQVTYLQLLMDSTAPGEPRGDMRRFLAAEYARDTVGALPLAASLFESIPQGWPDSPYAAKAWLAGRQLTGDTTDLRGQFSASPYMAVLRGEEGTSYSELEDSLANFSRALAAASQPKPKPTRSGATKRGDGTISPDDDDRPGSRRNQQRQRRPSTSRNPAAAAGGVPKE